MNSDFIKKGYISIINMIGYLILTFANFKKIINFEINWIIPNLIGIFIILYKNFRIVNSKYKLIIFLLDIVLIVLILFLTNFFGSSKGIYEINIIIVILLSYILFFIKWINEDKLILK